MSVPPGSGIKDITTADSTIGLFCHLEKNQLFIAFQHINRALVPFATMEEQKPDNIKPTIPPDETSKSHAAKVADKMFMCEQCPYSTTRRYNLTLHKRDTL